MQLQKSTASVRLFGEANQDTEEDVVIPECSVLDTKKVGRENRVTARVGQSGCNVASKKKGKTKTQARFH